jgi:hypothetical protein
MQKQCQNRTFQPNMTDHPYWMVAMLKDIDGIYEFIIGLHHATLFNLLTIASSIGFTLVPTTICQ